MKKLLKKSNITLFIISIFILFIGHFSLFNKNIISADILLNNNYYNGYSWEISLGRFGLYLIGFIKSYLNIVHIDLIISFVLIGISCILIIDLFNIKNKINKILLIVFICLNPIISATLLFNYCSIGYLLAFLCGILSLYIYIKSKNKYIKYIVPTLLIVTSLSMYQAYLSFIVSIYVIYFIKCLFNKKVNYKELIKYILCILIGVIVYFIIMKLSLLIFNINISSYCNADKICLKTLLTIPNKIIESYKLFYSFYFTDSIMKNTYMHNNIINILLFGIFIISLVINIIKNKVNTINIVIISILVLLLPIFLNSVIFVIDDSKLQLLMATSYLCIPCLLLSFDNYNYRYIVYVIVILLIRNYLVQIQATYLTLENTYNKYDTIISTAITNNINDLDKRFIVIGNIDNKNTEISKMNYGFISDDGLFWDEYNLRKLGFERFCNQYYGLDLTYGSEDEYKYILDYESDDLIYNIDQIIVINLNNYKKTVN